jgi:tetratricopeptide (TPR) repeat protein
MSRTEIDRLVAGAQQLRATATEDELALERSWNRLDSLVQDRLAASRPGKLEHRANAIRDFLLRALPSLVLLAWILGLGLNTIVVVSLTFLTLQILLDRAMIRRVRRGAASGPPSTFLEPEKNATVVERNAEDQFDSSDLKAGRRAAMWRAPQSTTQKTTAQIVPSRRSSLFQLPPDVDHFTGREKDLRALESLLHHSKDRPTSVLVSAVDGRAGIGKTALATRAAHELRRVFPDGQLYVDLLGTDAQRRDPGPLLGEVLLALGVARDAIPNHLEERVTRYREQLSDRRILVVLDNAAEEAQVRPLLPSSPGSAALITSRGPLEGLESTELIALDVLDDDKAVELLTKFVGAERVAEEPEAARKVVELSGHLPLAIRIAGAQLRTTETAPLVMLVNRLANERRRLANMNARDLEVRASFHLSYQELNGDERRALRLLALPKMSDFSAWVVAALLDIELSRAQDIIDSLVEAELIEIAQQTSTGQLRYSFHDLLRAFAQEQLRNEEPLNAQDMALRRLLDTYLGLATHASELLEPEVIPNYTTNPTVATFADTVKDISRDPAAWFESERKNLTAAVEQASDSGLHEVTWKLARALTYFFKLHTHWTDWQHVQLLALSSAQRVQQKDAIANALRSLADAHMQLREFTEAVAFFERALDLFRQLDQRPSEAWTLVGLGNAYREQGLLSEAIHQFTVALNLFRDLNIRRGEGWALEGLGNIWRNQGRFDEALTCFQEALKLFREAKDHRGEAYCLVNLGVVHRDRGEFPKALDFFEQAQPIFQQLGDHQGETHVFLNRGDILREQGHHNDASSILGSCLSAFKRLGDRAGEAWTRLKLGQNHQAQSRLADAVTEFRRSQTLFDQLDDRRGQAWTYMALGDAYRAQNVVEDAVRYYQQAVSMARDTEDPLALAKALRGYGLALEMKGDQEPALEKLREALTIFKKLGTRDASDVAASVARITKE